MYDLPCNTMMATAIKLLALVTLSPFAQNSEYQYSYTFPHISSKNFKIIFQSRVSIPIYKIIGGRQMFIFERCLGYPIVKISLLLILTKHIKSIQPFNKKMKLN